jgi:hypothetical protein
VCSSDLVFLSLALVLFSGCVFLERSVNVTVGKTNPELVRGTYAIMPFQDKRESGSADLGYNAVDAMTDAFETEFIGAGFKVVDRRNIQSALDELKFSYQGDVDPDQRKQIGKLTNSDVMIIGKLRTFQNAQFNNAVKPDKPSKCTSISFSVKAINIETGEIVWTGSLTKSTGYKDDFMYGCSCDVLKYSNRAANDFIKTIVKKTQQTIAEK